jgi:hypothetical protein
MNSQPGGLLTAVLMLVPLVGVPVAAIVGLPALPGTNVANAEVLTVSDELQSIGSADVSSTADSLDYLFTPVTGDPPVTHPRSDDSATAAPQIDDPFGLDSTELYTPFRELTTQPDREILNPIGDLQTAAAIPVSLSNDQPARTPPWADEDTVTSPVRNNTTPRSKTLTWEQAVARLNVLGIRNYRLEEDNRRGGYHFFCVLTPPQQPNVRHRFDASATQPLDAVADVFAQIDRWRADR